MREWALGQLLPGLPGAKHAWFSAFAEAVSPTLSWEMASKLCDSKNKQKIKKKVSLFNLACSPLRTSSSPAIAMRIRSIPSSSVDSESDVKYSA